MLYCVFCLQFFLIASFVLLVKSGSNVFGSTLLPSASLAPTLEVHLKDTNQYSNIAMIMLAGLISFLKFLLYHLQKTLVAFKEEMSSTLLCLKLPNNIVTSFSAHTVAGNHGHVA